MSGLALDEVSPGTERASPHWYGTGPKQMSLGEVAQCSAGSAACLVSGVVTHGAAWCHEALRVCSEVM